MILFMLSKWIFRRITTSFGFCISFTVQYCAAVHCSKCMLQPNTEVCLYIKFSQNRNPPLDRDVLGLWYLCVCMSDEAPWVCISGGLLVKNEREVETVTFAFYSTSTGVAQPLATTWQLVNHCENNREDNSPGQSFSFETRALVLPECYLSSKTIIHLIRIDFTFPRVQRHVITVVILRHPSNQLVTSVSPSTLPVMTSPVFKSSSVITQVCKTP